MRISSQRRAALLLVAAIGVANSAAQGAEVTVQNDSLTGGDQGIIQAGFDAGESGAAWLTSPCAGDIVAVQVFWRSTTGTAGQSLEDSITIFDGGAFPTPGPQLEIIEGPVMTDGVFNEFRFLDENMVIPLIVPVTNGQTFVVSFRFFNDPDPGAGPSLVNDVDGCQAGKNTIDAVGIGWISSCLLGVTGDWIIRAVVDCQEVAAPGSVPNGEDPDPPLLMSKVGDGQLQLTWSSSCAAGDDNYEIYEGFIPAWYSHFRKVCETANDTMFTFAPDQFDRYYLVVPTNDALALEGSYGLANPGGERPQGGNACHDRVVSCP
jgi:hypothetical protein